MSDWILALGGLVTTGGAAWWIKSHTHDDLVPRPELEALRELLLAQHAAVLRELDQLREMLDSTRRSR